IVFHHEQCVAKLFQFLKGVVQTITVARVQANRWLIKHIENTGESAAKLACQPDALGFSAR
ncbi:hypothetical protein JG666_22495, partial [Vibrio cholerae]|nr:hypothetical protein [Vibrio cholerae]